MFCLVTGATGALGSAVVRGLVDAGETVRAVIRSREKTALAFGQRQPESVLGNVLDAEWLARAADGAEVIYHCANFALDRFELHKTAVANVVRAAARAGACVVCPGNVWVYGPARYLPIDEEHPLEPTSRLGQLKLDAENAILESADKAGVSATIVHLPDFYGLNVLNALLKPIFLNALRGKTVRWLGNLDIPHEFIYIDDAAEALIAVSKAERCAGRRLNAPGRGTITPRRFIELAFSAAGMPVKIARIIPIFLRIAAFFNTDARLISELSYLMNEAFYLEGVLIKETTGWEAKTSYTDGTRLTVQWFRENLTL